LSNLERFGEALVLYERAVAKRDYQSAVDRMLEVIDANPYPSLYAHFALCLEQARAALSAVQAQQAWEKTSKLKRALTIRKPMTNPLANKASVL
jgi:hypothetical protein